MVFTQQAYSEHNSNLFPSFFFSEQGLQAQCVIESSGAWTFYSCNLCKHSFLSLSTGSGFLLCTLPHITAASKGERSWWKPNVIISVLPPGWWQDLYTARWTTRSPSKWRTFTSFRGQLLQPSVSLGSGNQRKRADRNILQTSGAISTFHPAHHRQHTLQSSYTAEGSSWVLGAGVVFAQDWNQHLMEPVLFL